MSITVVFSYDTLCFAGKDLDMPEHVQIALAVFFFIQMLNILWLL